MLTADWTDDDVSAYVAFCEQCEAPVDVPITVWANESDNRTTAHNPNGDASGLCQMMPETMRGLGYDVDADPTLAGFRKMSVSEQLAWCMKFYSPNAGQLGTVGRWYVATFLPAFLDRSDNPGTILCRAGGGGFAWAYEANKTFDRAGKGWITVQDLIDAANRAVGPRTRELFARVAVVQAAAVDTEAPPDNPVGVLHDSDDHVTIRNG